MIATKIVEKIADLIVIDHEGIRWPKEWHQKKELWVKHTDPKTNRVIYLRLHDEAITETHKLVLNETDVYMLIQSLMESIWIMHSDELIGAVETTGPGGTYRLITTWSGYHQDGSAHHHYRMYAYDDTGDNAAMKGWCSLGPDDYQPPAVPPTSGRVDKVAPEDGYIDTIGPVSLVVLKTSTGYQFYLPHEDISVEGTVKLIGAISLPYPLRSQEEETLLVGCEVKWEMVTNEGEPRLIVQVVSRFTLSETDETETLTVCTQFNG